MSRRRVRVPDGPARRLDQLLREALAGVSRRAVQQALAAGRIRVDGRRARKGDLFPSGAEIEVDLEELPGSLTPEPDLAVPILFEDDALIAVDKPAGLPSNALSTEDHGTIANFLIAHFPGIEAASERPLDAGLVHRLDTGTSGVLLAARTRTDWTPVRDQFGARTVRKLYVARVVGRVERERTIDAAIDADPRDRRKVRVVDPGTRAPEARPAITRLRPVGRSADTSLLEVTIETGMRHQIRAHLAAIGHPVCGDELYGGPADERLWLHAQELELKHPRTGRRLRIRSEPPRELGSP